MCPLLRLCSTVFHLKITHLWLRNLTIRSVLAIQAFNRSWLTQNQTRRWPLRVGTLQLKKLMAIKRQRCSSRACTTPRMELQWMKKILGATCPSWWIAMRSREDTSAPGSITMSPRVSMPTHITVSTPKQEELERDRNMWMRHPTNRNLQLLNSWNTSRLKKSGWRKWKKRIDF